MRLELNERTSLLRRDIYYIHKNFVALVSRGLFIEPQTADTTTLNSYALKSNSMKLQRSQISLLISSRLKLTPQIS